MKFSSNDTLNIKELKQFERDIIKILKTCNIAKIRDFIQFNQNCNCNIYLIRTAMIFRLLGAIKMPAKDKFLLLEMLSSCFEERLDRRFTNITVLESIALGYEINENLVRDFAIFDSKIKGVNLAEYLFDNNSIFLLDLYLKHFPNQIEQVYLKLSIMDDVNSILLNKLKSSIPPYVANILISKIDKIILISTFTEIVIPYEEVNDFNINFLPAIQFINRGKEFIYQVKLITKKDFIVNDNFDIAITNIVGIKIYSEDMIFNYDIPKFFEYHIGSNYLQRYHNESNNFIFEYDYYSLSNSVFPNKEFEAVIKGCLDLDLHKNISEESINKLTTLNLFFDAVYEFFTLEQVLENLNNLPKLKKLGIHFENGYRPVNINFEKIDKLNNLEYLLVDAEDINLYNFDSIIDKKISIITKNRYENSTEIFLIRKGL